MSESNGDELDTSTALGEESSEEAPPRVVVKRYRKATPATSLAQQPSSSQEHLVASTSAPPLMQSKPKFGPGPRGYAPPHMTINPYPLPATLRTQMHITAHWQDRLQPQETTYRPKLPPFAKGTPLAPPRDIAARTRCDMPVLRTGGQPPPRPRPTPRSLMFRQPGRVAAAHTPPMQPQRDAPYRKTHSALLSASAGITTQRAMPLSPAPVREQAPTTTKARNAAARTLAEQTFIDLANRIGPACEAFLQLSASANFASHLRRLVAPTAKISPGQPCVRGLPCHDSIAKWQAMPQQHQGIADGRLHVGMLRKQRGRSRSAHDEPGLQHQSTPMDCQNPAMAGTLRGTVVPRHLSIWQAVA